MTENKYARSLLKLHHGKKNHAEVTCDVVIAEKEMVIEAFTKDGDEKSALFEQTNLDYFKKVKIELTTL